MLLTSVWLVLVHPTPYPVFSMYGALDMLHTPAQATLSFSEYQHTFIAAFVTAVAVYFVMMIGPPQGGHTHQLPAMCSAAALLS